MKKNKMMRLASGLLVATLLTTSMISGTFAKYVTDGKAEDTARVAKFGVTVTGSGYLFDKTYKDVDETNGNTPGGEATVLTVVSSTDEKVIAPGTKSNDDGMNINISGTPEVDVEVKHEVTVDLSQWVDANGTFYCPLVFTVDGTELKGYDSETAFEEALVNAINGSGNGTYIYDAKTDLGAQPDNQICITWKWPFEGDDVRDTFLGDNAAKGNPASVSITIKTTVTQID